MHELTLIEKAFFLKKTTLFSELELDLVLAIANKAEIRIQTNDELIFSVNQDAHCLYVIVSGSVMIENENEEEIERLTAPDYFGDEALFTRESRSYSAKAIGDTTLMLISRSHLTEIILECPQVALSLLRGFAASCTYRKRKEEE